MIFKKDFPQAKNKSKFPQLITMVYQKTNKQQKKTFILDGKRVRAFLLEPGKRQGYLL